MRAAPILAVLLATLAAAPAGAWEESPFRTLPGRSPASCLRATGADGGLTALGPSATRTTPVDLLAAGAGAPAVRARARFGVLIDCPVLREQGGAAVAAGVDFRLTGAVAIRAMVRDAGAAFERPVQLGRSVLSEAAYDAAVSASGHAVVAWFQVAGTGARERSRVVVARRAPGGAFGPPAALSPWAHAEEPLFAVVAGVDGAGAATVAWTAPAARRGEKVEVAVARAGPGAVFGAPHVLAPRAGP